jgi:hypothetical protein
MVRVKQKSKLDPGQYRDMAKGVYPERLFRITATGYQPKRADHGYLRLTHRKMLRMQFVCPDGSDPGGVRSGADKDYPEA